MSQQNQNQDSRLESFAGVVLTLTFVIIFALISGNSNDVGFVPAVPTPISEQVAAQVVPVDTAQPTATPLPPTATPTVMPTNTSAPTFTALPSNTPIPAETESPQIASNNEQSSPSDVVTNYDPALVEQGESLFVQCVACHGPDARGLPNLGKNLVESEFVASQTDDALVQFIITGRPIWDPLNTTGIDMPGKGGNPAMTTEDIQAIVAYIRSLAASGG